VAGIASATARCDPTATSDRGIAGVTWGASAGDNVVAVSLSSSDCAGPLVRFELFADLRVARNLLRKLDEGVKLRRVSKCQAVEKE